LDQPLGDGAVRGPGRLRIARAISDPGEPAVGWNGPQDRDNFHASGSALAKAELAHLWPTLPLDSA
jgi:hypothetical protein